MRSLFLFVVLVVVLVSSAFAQGAFAPERMTRVEFSAFVAADKGGTYNKAFAKAVLLNTDEDEEVSKALESSIIPSAPYGASTTALPRYDVPSFVLKLKVKDAPAGLYEVWNITSRIDPKTKGVVYTMGPATKRQIKKGEEKALFCDDKLVALYRCWNPCRLIEEKKEAPVPLPVLTTPHDGGKSQAPSPADESKTYEYKAPPVATSAARPACTTGPIEPEALERVRVQRARRAQARPASAPPIQTAQAQAAPPVGVRIAHHTCNICGVEFYSHAESEGCGSCDGLYRDHYNRRHASRSVVVRRPLVQVVVRRGSPYSYGGGYGYGRSRVAHHHHEHPSVVINGGGGSAFSDGPRFGSGGSAFSGGSSGGGRFGSGGPTFGSGGGSGSGGSDPFGAGRYVSGGR